jgi:hypothetical protein
VTDPAPKRRLTSLQIDTEFDEAISAIIAHTGAASMRQVLRELTLAAAADIAKNEKPASSEKKGELLAG